MDVSIHRAVAVSYKRYRSADNTTQWITLEITNIDKTTDEITIFSANSKPLELVEKTHE